MKTLTTRSLTIFTFIFVWFTILFDPSNLALGARLIALPDFILGLAEIFGNLLWLLGFFLFSVGVLLTIALFLTDETKKIINEGIDKISKDDMQDIEPYDIINDSGDFMYKRYKWWTKSLLYINTIGSLIAIGSGFWFTGTGWLLTIITSFIYREISFGIAEKLIKERLEKENG